jgi:hypothetical protein
LYYGITNIAFSNCFHFLPKHFWKLLLQCFLLPPAAVWNINYLPFYKASYPRRHEDTSVILMWIRITSHVSAEVRDTRVHSTVNHTFTEMVEYPLFNTLPLLVSFKSVIMNLT